MLILATLLCDVLVLPSAVKTQRFRQLRRAVGIVAGHVVVMIIGWPGTGRPGGH